MKKLVSIIVPLYNKEKYIDRCICSILEQTYKNFEILVIDDGSTDNSLKILKERFKDERIKIFEKENGGASSARNLGIANCKGDKVLFIDADDYIDEDYIEQLIKYEEDFVICSYKTIKNGKENIEIRVSNVEKKGKKAISEVLSPKMKRIMSTPYVKLFDKRILLSNNIKFNEDMNYGEDTCFVFEYINHINSIRIINYNGYNNVVEDDDSLSRKYVKNIIEQMNVLNITISSIKAAERDEKNYWYLRNLKTILYNERNSRYFQFKSVIKLIKNDKFYDKININNKLFSKTDCLLLVLFKIRLYFTIYLLYKVK